MERGPLPHGELLQGLQAGVVEQVRAGQEDGRPGVPAAARPQGCSGVEGERGQADGALADLPAGGLQHRWAGVSWRWSVPDTE